MRRLRFKLLTLGVSLVVATQLGTLISLLITVDRDAAVTASTKLDSGDARLNEYMRQRNEALRQSLAAVIEDRRFSESVWAQDTRKTARELTRQANALEAEFAVVLDPQGSILASSDEAPAASTVLPGVLLGSAAEDIARSAIRFEGSVYEMLTLPVTDHRPTAWLSMAFPVDAKLAYELKTETGLDVTLLANGDDRPELLATSLSGPAAGGADIAAELTALNLRAPNSGTLTLAGQSFVARERPFVQGSTPIQILLKAPIPARTVPYEASRKVTIALGLFALLIAMIGAMTVSAEITRALKRFTMAVRRIGNGNYDETIRVGKNQELAELAVAVNAMQAKIAKRENQMAYESQFDRITGLPNRFLAEQRLQQSLQKLDGSNYAVSVMIVGLNCLQEINDSFGHDVGDAVLEQAGEQLRATLDCEHTLARLEGDDFLVIMEDTLPDVALEVASDLLQSIDAGIWALGVRIGIGASIGICTYPDAGTGADQLLQHAGVAKADAAQSPEKICVYRDGKEDRHVRQLTLLKDLERAVQNDELKIYLQPKVRLADGGVCGAEALARWDHPTLGFLPSREFIAIAKQSGNASLVSRWAVAAAIRTCRQWIEEGLDLPVSVNLTGHNLCDPEFISHIESSLQKSDLDPRHLMIEISETAFIPSFEKAACVMQGLQDMGIRVSTDDFGTGRSSFMRLKHLPADELQIARWFIKELPGGDKDAAIVQTSIELAHRMNMQVAAKGLESRAAMGWLADHGCDVAQGYFISRPIPAETFSQWVAHYNVDATAYVSVLEAISH